MIFFKAISQRRWVRQPRPGPVLRSLLPHRAPAINAPREDASPPGENVLPRSNSGIPRTTVQGAAAFWKATPLPSPVSFGIPRKPRRIRGEKKVGGGSRRKKKKEKKIPKSERKLQLPKTKRKLLFGKCNFRLLFIGCSRAAPRPGMGGSRARSRGPCPPHGRHGGDGQSQPVATTKTAASPCTRQYIYLYFNRKQAGKGELLSLHTHLTPLRRGSPFPTPLPLENNKRCLENAAQPGARSQAAGFFFYGYLRSQTRTR